MLVSISCFKVKMITYYLLPMISFYVSGSLFMYHLVQDFANPVYPTNLHQSSLASVLGPCFQGALPDFWLTHYIIISVGTSI